MQGLLRTKLKYLEKHYFCVFSIMDEFVVGHFGARQKSPNLMLQYLRFGYSNFEQFCWNVFDHFRGHL